jgi:phosphatidate cytidylyltransferase
VTESLRKRILTAAVLAVALLVTVLYLPSWATLAVVSAVVLLGAWEWSGFLRLPGTGLRLAYVGLIAVLMFAAWSFTVTARGRALLMGVALLWWCIALLWIMLAPRRVATWSAASAGVLALVPAWLALVRLRLDPAAGAQWVLYALILVWLADIGAFFSGRRFGRVSLAPGQLWIAINFTLYLTGSFTGTATGKITTPNAGGPANFPFTWATSGAGLSGPTTFAPFRKNASGAPLALFFSNNGHLWSWDGLNPGTLTQIDPT